MSTAALAPQPVLADRLISRSLTTDIALVLTGAMVVGALAQISIPMFPVSITGQTLAVLLVGGSLGMRRGAMALFTYLAVGVAGVPWFSDFTGGPAALVKPSFGYIIGFVFAAALMGWLAERNWDRRPFLSMVGFLFASLVPFAFGLPYLAVVLGITDVSLVLEYGFTPFILGGLIKCAIAAAIFPMAWAAVRRVDDRNR
ncbi:MAG: biotin transporter BioY [Ornithinimicrobium sp.]